MQALNVNWDDLSEYITDEDVARGSLEDGWVPTFLFDIWNELPADAPAGTLAFLTCSWPVRRLPDGVWRVKNAGEDIVVKKMRVVLEDEELVLMPCDLEDAQVGWMIFFVARDKLTSIAICVEREKDTGYPPHRLVGGGQLRVVGGPLLEAYDTYVVCKQPTASHFILK